MRIVEVHWEDSIGAMGIWESSGWVEDLIPSMIVTVGWELSKTKGHVTVANSVGKDDPDGNVQGAICIPRSAIRKVKVLRK